MDLLPKEPELVARLASYRLFQSSDLDETRSSVGRIFKPHELGVRGTQQNLNAQMDHLALGKASINRLQYGANVTIEPECLDDFLLVQMPMQGRAHIRCGAHEITSTPTNASVITPSLPLHMRWQGECDQLIVRIERSTLESICSAHLGYALPRPLEFQLGMDLSKGNGLAWKTLIEFLATSPFIVGAGDHAMVTSQVEQLLATTLLTRHPHNFSHVFQDTPATPAPSYVKRAEDYILAHCDQPITIQDLAHHTAISARSLHKGFQQHRGVSPMAFLRLVRLQRVREQLLQARQANQAISITQVALSWGFGHLGHFAQAYRLQFNETPSQTLGR